MGNNGSAVKSRHVIDLGFGLESKGLGLGLASKGLGLGLVS